MPKRIAYQRTLTQLENLLKRRPFTAREIAVLMSCCRLSAYQRIAALRARGARVYEITEARAEGVTGPAAVAYGIR